MQIAIPIFPGFTALDVIGPYQVFTNLPGADVALCAAGRGLVTDDIGVVRLGVTHTLDEMPSPDVLVAPGGLVTRRMARDGDPVIDWIREAHPKTAVTASVCTGTLLLIAAGLLQDDRATSHWIAYDALAAAGVTPTDERVVQSGKILTAAGVSAGIDLALTVVAQLAGDDVARAIQLGIEYDPQPPFDAGSPSKAPPLIHQLVSELLTTAQAEILETPTRRRTVS